MDFKTGILALTIVIAIVGMMASSVIAAWTITDITGDTIDKDGDCSGEKISGDYLVSLCESHISEGGKVDATATATDNNGLSDTESATFYYGWPYRIGAYAKAGGSDNWHYASVYRY